VAVALDATEDSIGAIIDRVRAEIEAIEPLTSTLPGSIPRMAPPRM
jgi:hypothetical protein